MSCTFTEAPMEGVSVMEALSDLLDPSDRCAQPSASDPQPPGPSSADSSAVMASFNRMSPHGDWLVKYFYAHLFTNHPEVRPLFPDDMNAQRDRFLFAMIRIVGEMADGKIDADYLERLGRSHRDHMGVVADHYPAAGESLIATLAKFHGQRWTPELEASWTNAYQAISDAMLAGT